MLICGMFVFSAYAQKVFTLKSPSGKLSATISSGKQLTYDVSCNGRQVVAPSAISMTLDNGEVWGAGARLSGSKTSSVDEMVVSPFYRTSEMRDHYNGLVLRFKGGYDVEFRAYDDGIAYRFVSKTKKKFNVVNEQADFSFPFDATASVPYVNRGDDNNMESQFFNSFENIYDTNNISKLNKNV